MTTNPMVTRGAAAQRLCAALGLDASKVTSLTITFEQGGAVTAHATIPITYSGTRLDVDAMEDYIGAADGLTVTTEQADLTDEADR